MNYCEVCGEKLVMKDNGVDGSIPFCLKYNQFKFPMYNSAISAIVFNKDKTI